MKIAKPKNIFKFKSFSDRLSEIDIRKQALYHVAHPNEEREDDTETQFYSTYEKWFGLNLTEEFGSFLKATGRIVTLPQLVHKKDFVIDHLEKCLEKSTNLSLQPLLEFVVALAKDLREEFYPYFKRFLVVLINLLNTNDPEQIEWTLICLAYLFKILKPFLKKEISMVFKLILPLLSDSNKIEITNFAAECFSFVARDIRDKEALIASILKTINSNCDGITGCGNLFYEIVRGVNGRFHNCAEQFLIQIFECFRNESLIQYNNLLQEILTVTIDNINANITRENNAIFWSSLLKCIENLEIELIKGENNQIENSIDSLLQCVGQIVSYKSGINVTKPSELVNRILSLVKLNISEKLSLTISNVVAGILLSECIEIEQYESTTLCRQILSIGYNTVFESFVLSMVNYSQFDLQILPEFLKYFNSHYSDSCLHFLCTIIIKKSPPCWSGVGLENWKIYSIKHKFDSKCLQRIEYFVQDFKQNLGNFFASVICSTHIESLNKKIVLQGLHKNLKEIMELLKIGADVMDNKRNIFLMSIVVEALVHFDETLDIENLIDALITYVDDYNYVQALRIIDLLVTHQVQNKEVALFEKLQAKISKNLSSPYHEIRLLTAHILMHFNDLYGFIFKIENTKSDIHNYRHQIQILTTFSCDTEYYKNSLQDTKINLDPLRYLFGLLYVNFKLLWEPISKIIANYSEHINAQQFWPILESSFIFCNNAITQGVIEQNNQVLSLESNNELVEEYFYSSYELKDKLDFVNFRCLLLNCIAECGQLSETKNRELIPIFLKFIDEEYRATNKELQMTQNISNTMDETKPDRNEYRKSNAVQRTLINYLRIFSKMTNIKGIYKQDILHDIIYDLLSHANFEVQKLALDCMMKYKIKSLQLYKENLYNIIEEKTFKNEVVALKIDENVQEREKLVSILMKILLSKLGMKMHSNKNTGNLRKSLIFRCLSSNCNEQEILKFVKLHLKKYDFFLNLDNDEYKSDTIDLENYLNPKKIQSILTFVDTVRTNYAGIMNDNFIKFMIHVIFIVGKKLQLVLDRQAEVKPVVITTVKSLRNVVMSSLISVFDQFDEYNWTDKQFDVMFEIFVWPNLAKLPSDSIHTPTQLLKLFIEFGKSDSHQALLFKQFKNDENFTPTHFLIKLLQNPNASRVVNRTIMEIVDNLLQTNSELLTPFISDILNKIETNLSKSGRPQLVQSDLNVLSMLTKLDIDPKFCDKLLSLILPAMIKQLKLRTIKEDAVAQTLKTISNLLVKVDTPMKYFRILIPLFLQLNEWPTRSVLCEIIKDMTKDNERIAEIVSGLNALSKRWADQPDHEVRLSTFRTIGELTKSGDLSINACLIIIYHCFYILKHDNDLAMRDSSAYHLKLAVLATVSKYTEIDKLEIEYLIGTVLLNLVRNSITDRNSVVRTEGILLLGELVREFPKCHQVLSDLHPLTNKTDREVDFFDNITHLQSHRQGRALIKFCEIANTCEKPPCSRTLTQFILPIASSYVCKEAYLKKHGVIDASIQTIGTVCRLLPWYQYELVLRFYLNKLKSNFEYQKQIVRIVMGILDSFHFDLSKASGISVVIREKMEKPKHEIKKIQESEEDNAVSDLENVLDEIEEVVREENSDVPFESNKYQIIDKLTPAAAKKLISTLTNNIIPMLNNSISKLSVHEASHKFNKGHKTKEVEDEHTLKVPIALAIVKLLQKLPHGALDTNLPGIFLKVGTFLKSRLKSIRMLSRDILRKIMVSVGPTYLGMLLTHLSSLLTRGYQCHVFAITLHNVLDALKNDFKPTDIDKNLATILHICMDDIFGATAAEKEVEKLAANTPEAKPSNKSYMILNIVAQNISEVSLLDIMIPFKEQLRKSQSKKVTNKIYEAFKKITAGLIENKYITIESLVIFVYGVTSASIPDLQIVKSHWNKLKAKTIQNIKKSDTFIIPQAPKISNSTINAVVKTNNQANAHILIEFGLEMLHIILKRRLNDGLDYTQYINPFISLIDSSLNSFNVGVATYALKCLTTIWNLKLTYPDLGTSVESMVSKIFHILHKYATVGMSTNSENYHLVKNVFKAVVALLKHVDYYTITEDQLKILLLHAEQDLHSSDKSHSFAFSLLKAVLTKKLVTSEIHEIMDKVSEISILSESNSIREEARSIFLSYFMNYSLGKKVETFLKFYVNQLSVDVITGRQSAIHCLTTIIKKLPLHLLKQQSGFLFLSIGTRMVNDDEADCRALAANTIESLLQRLDQNDLDKLFEIVVLLLNDDKPIHCEMGAQLCTRFVSAEQSKFVPRVKHIFPLLLTKLAANNSEETGKFVKQFNKEVVAENSSEETEDDRSETQIDHQVIQIQNLIIKIIENCSEILDNHKMNEFIDELAYSSQRLLNDDHAWIRVNAIKVLEKILANTDYEFIQKVLINVAQAQSNKYRTFLYTNPVSDIKSLVLDHTAQLIPSATNEDTANAVMKNLLYIANFLKNTVTDGTETSTDENENPRINLIWLIRKVRFAINSEVAKAPLQIIIRTAAFNWILGLLSILDEINIRNLAQTLLGPLVREMSEEDAVINPKLRQLAIKIGNRMKKILGEDDYNIIRSRIQTKLIVTRAKRKKVIAQEKINDVELAMKRKVGVKNRKIKAQKRKNEMFKGKPISKKKRKLEID